MASRQTKALTILGKNMPCGCDREQFVDVGNYSSRLGRKCWRHNVMLHLEQIYVQIDLERLSISMFCGVRILSDVGKNEIHQTDISLSHDDFAD